MAYQDQFEVELTSDRPAEVTFRGPSSDNLLLIYGRLKVAGTQEIGNPRIDGPIEQAALFNTWLRGV